MGPYLLIYDTVGLYPLIFLHIGHHPRQLLFTDCPASSPPLLVQWAHTSSFMTRWAYTLSFTYTVSTTLAIYCTECPASLPPLLVQWAHTSSFYDTGGIYPLVYLHSGHHPRHLLYRMSSFTSSLTCTVGHTSSFYDTGGIYPLVYLHSGHHPRHLLHRMSSLTSSLTCTVGPYLLLL